MARLIEIQSSKIVHQQIIMYTIARVSYTINTYSVSFKIKEAKIKNAFIQQMLKESFSSLIGTTYAKK